MSDQLELPDYLEFLNTNQYSVMHPLLRQHLNNFLCRREELLLELYKAGADMRLVFDALCFIWDEELSDKSEPTYFETADADLLEFDLHEPEIHTYKEGKQIALTGAMPGWIESILRQIENDLVIQEEKYSIKGKFDITVTAELRNGSERFTVKHSFSKPLMRPKKGRKGEPQSGFVMFVLSEHFSDVKIKRKYSRIVELINSFSINQFSPGTGAPLNEDKVRQYVKRIKKKPGAIKWCLDFRTQRTVREEEIPEYYLDDGA